MFDNDSRKDFRKGGLFFMITAPATAFAVIMLWSWIFIN